MKCEYQNKIKLKDSKYPFHVCLHPSVFQRTKSHILAISCDKPIRLCQIIQEGKDEKIN